MSSTTAPLPSDAVAERHHGRRALAALRLIVAVQFAIGGALKLGGADTMVTMFADVGLGDWLRYLVGILEVAGAIGLLIPGLIRAAAAGLAGLMLGAVITRSVVLGGPPVLELALLVILVMFARERR